MGQRTKADESSALHEQHGDAPMLGSPLEIPSINGDTGSSSNLKKGRSGGNGRGRGRGRNQTQTREQQQQQQQQPRSQAAQHMLDLRKGVLVDDDGFEKLVKKQAPSQPQGQAGRGRGGGQRSRGDRGMFPNSYVHELRIADLADSEQVVAHPRTLHRVTSRRRTVNRSRSRSRNDTSRNRSSSRVCTRRTSSSHRGMIAQIARGSTARTYHMTHRVSPAALISVASHMHH